MAKATIRVYKKQKLVTFKGTLTDYQRENLKFYAVQGYEIRESKPAKKRNGTNVKDAWKAVMTPEDAAIFEDKCHGTEGFFGARSWAKEQGYSIDTKEEEAKPAKKTTTRTTATKKTAPKAEETAKAEETSTEEAK